MRKHAQPIRVKSVKTSWEKCSKAVFINRLCMISPRAQVITMHVLREKCNSVSRSWCKHKAISQNVRASQVLYQTQLLNQSNNQCMYSVCHCQLVQYHISQTHSYRWRNHSINTCKTVSVSPVLHQSDTQLLLRHSVNQYM